MNIYIYTIDIYIYMYVSIQRPTHTRTHALAHAHTRAYLDRACRAEMREAFALGKSVRLVSLGAGLRDAPCC